jgi:regulator of sigma E protease
MSYILAFLGISALIVIHEFGHFAAAKLVGMRVERFALFFGPLALKRQVGETEYGIGIIPLGGYAKISGMSPEEDLPPEVVPRAYYNQPAWKRIFVVAAGPAINIVVAFVIAWFVLIGSTQGVVNHKGQPVLVVHSVQAGSAAAGVLKAGDEIVAINGVAANFTSLPAQISADRCPGAQASGCKAAKPVTFEVIRAKKRLTLTATPAYNAKDREMLVGFVFGQQQAPIDAVTGARLSGTWMWDVTSSTVSTLVRIFEPKERRQLHSIVGIYSYTQQSFAEGPSQAFQLIALISLALAIINLFPVLPLDGGHIFWTLVEKVRGRRVPLATIERASLVGIVLIVGLIAVGLTNDISSIVGKGLVLPK